MNITKLNALIEATKTFPNFNMKYHHTCLCGVAQSLGADTMEDFTDTTQLAKWLEWPQPKEGWAPVMVLAMHTTATREEAVTALEHLRDTGEVAWK